MNIFYLDKDPKLAAQMACDKHCSKMIVESCQMLSTAHRIQDGTEYYGKTANGRKIKRWKHPNSNLEPILYKASHVNHPSTKWVMDSAFNYVWLFNHMLELNEEFKKRYGHTQDHKSVRLLKQILSHPPVNANWKKKGSDATPAMPEHCKVPGDSVASYRKYYILEKRRFATWKAPAKTPSWYMEGVKNGQ